MKEAITRYYLSFVGMWSITTLLIMFTQAPVMATKKDDSITTISSDLARRRRSPETVDVRVQATDKKRTLFFYLHGYTGHHYNQIHYCPTNALNYINCRVIKRRMR